VNFSADDKRKLDKTASDISYIRGALDTKILPALTKDIPDLYDKNNKNEKSVALVEKAQMECPARKAHESRFNRLGSWIAAGALVVAFATLMVMIYQTTKRPMKAKAEETRNAIAN
jgi:hypothetical protein